MYMVDHIHLATPISAFGYSPSLGRLLSRLAARKPAFHTQIQ
jgi:hypothetical protein